MTFNLLANDDPGLPYLAGTSFGKGPMPLGSGTIGSGTTGLSVDPLLQVSISGAWPISLGHSSTRPIPLAS